jgi:tetratricopeptide (TPR) repeat protein
VIYPLANLERWDEVMVQYNEILKLDPTNMTANFQLALINYNRKDYAQALPYINTYVTSYPFNFDGVNLMGWIHYASGKKDLAKIYFQKAILINPSSKNYELLPEMK